MPTTPIGPNGLFKILYSIASGMTHKLNLRVNYVTPMVPGVAPTIQAHSGSGADKTATQMLDAIYTYWSPMYLAADAIDSYECWDVTTDPPTLLYSANPSSKIGTHSGGNTQRTESQLTLTFRDGSNKKVRHMFFATVEGGVVRGASAAGHAWADWVTQMTATNAATLHDYIMGRSGDQVLNFVSWSLQNNNALEKKILYG